MVENFAYILGTVMLDHVLGICKADGNYDNVFLWVYHIVS